MRWGAAMALVLGLVVGGGAGASLGAEAPKTLSPERLKRFLGPEGEAQVQARRAIEEQGVAAVPALRRAARSCDEGRRGRLIRLIDRMVATWQRAQTPKGMVFVPAGYVELPRVAAPWGPSGERKAVRAFYIDRTEVTVGAWRAYQAKLMAARDPRLLGRWGGTMVDDDEPADWPATGMSEPQARRYARTERKGRLPLADEFERALRGSSRQRWPWGRGLDSTRANLLGLGAGTRMPVGSFPAGASPYGVLDLVGNVAEWSATYRLMGKMQSRAPLVLGGSFQHEAHAGLTWRARQVHADEPQIGGPARDWVGFRVVRDVPQPPAD